jgi:hypothetical protein
MVPVLDYSSPSRQRSDRRWFRRWIPLILILGIWVCLQFYYFSIVSPIGNTNSLFGIRVGYGWIVIQVQNRQGYYATIPKPPGGDLGLGPQSLGSERASVFSDVLDWVHGGGPLGSEPSMSRRWRTTERPGLLIVSQSFSFSYPPGVAGAFGRGLTGSARNLTISLSLWWPTAFIFVSWAARWLRRTIKRRKGNM